MNRRNATFILIFLRKIFYIFTSHNFHTHNECTTCAEVPVVYYQVVLHRKNIAEVA